MFIHLALRWEQAAPQALGYHHNLPFHLGLRPRLINILQKDDRKKQLSSLKCIYSCACACNETCIDANFVSSILVLKVTIFSTCDNVQL
jgi:hypothetical protein